MQNLLFNPQFLLIATTNFCLFLVVSTWSFLPVVIDEWGGTKADMGLIMGSIGVTSLGILPLLAPLIDRYGRKWFIRIGILLIGLSNAGFLLFTTYSPLLILVRLVQGLAFAACFNGCATAVVDRVPPENRAQGIGLFGVSGSLAIAVGPMLGEQMLNSYGTQGYFLLLAIFGIAGFVLSVFITEPKGMAPRKPAHGFFLTAYKNGYLSMMAMAMVFGSGFAAMNTFFPLYAKSLGLQAGLFFLCYGASLILIRVFLGGLPDRINRDKLIFACLLGFGVMLSWTSQISRMSQICFLGCLFGIVQGLSYPAMMARMVDRAGDNNRGVVVALFTGSFGIGINASSLAWGSIADANGLPFMFVVGGLLMFAGAFASIFSSSSMVQQDIGNY
jgi:MFS family permease